MGRRIGEINLHLQEITARAKKRDLDIEILNNTVATLQNSVIELEGGHASRAHNLSSTTLVHWYKRDTVDLWHPPDFQRPSISR